MKPEHAYCVAKEFGRGLLADTTKRLVKCLTHKHMLIAYAYILIALVLTIPIHDGLQQWHIKGIDGTLLNKVVFFLVPIYFGVLAAFVMWWTYGFYLMFTWGMEDLKGRLDKAYKTCLDRYQSQRKDHV